MYGMVLMAAMTGTGDVTSFGDKGTSCTGCTGCSGYTHHIFGGCHGGLFGHKHSCHGSCTGCYGSVPAPVVAAAPVVATPACCTPAPTPACCPEHVKHHGLFSGFKLFGHKHKECCEAPVTTPCCPSTSTPPAVVVPPTAPVPMPMDKKTTDKKPGTSD
jgi:hypothetical protein